MLHPTRVVQPFPLHTRPCRETRCSGSAGAGDTRHSRGDPGAEWSRGGFGYPWAVLGRHWHPIWLKALLPVAQAPRCRDTCPHRLRSACASRQTAARFALGAAGPQLVFTRDSGSVLHKSWKSSSGSTPFVPFERAAENPSHGAYVH